MTWRWFGASLVSSRRSALCQRTVITAYNDDDGETATATTNNVPYVKNFPLVDAEVLTL